jgi:DNA-binding Lrp family transcriptional regulator
MVADYHIDLGFDLGPDGVGKPRIASPHHATSGPVDVAVLRGQLESADYALATALESGLELTPLPYATLAARCGMSEAACQARLERLQGLSVIRRFGVVVRHRELGYTANAMVVWDIPDEQVAQVGRQLAEQPGVTLCYQRPRHLPDWPYNLFSMVHGRDHDAVLSQLAQIRNVLGLEAVRYQPLFSKRRFKQCGARYSSFSKAA